MALANKVIYQTGAIREFEKPEVCEAIKVANANKWTVSLSPLEWYKREARLKKEYEKNTNAPGPGEEQPKEGNPALKEAASQLNDALLDEQTKTIAKQNKEITRLISLVEKKENSISRLYYEKSVLEKENEELKKGEIPAKYFDKALVDEQAEKIKKLEHEKLNILEMASSCKQTVAERGKEISRLNKAIYKKNMKIEELRKESSEHLRGKVKLFGETVDLSQEICDKNEELRLSKIREKNLTDVCQKYMKENEKLKKELADKVVDKIDAQALKSAESALAEKDEVIADLGKELAATKKQLEEKTKLVEIIRNGSKEYCDYGVAANEFIKKLASLYVLAGNTGIINDEILERCKNYQSYGFPANCNRETKKEINDIASGKTKAVGVDIAEEGGDHSGKIVICGKDFGKILKENGEAAEELSKVLNDVIDQFLLFGEIIIKTEK